MTHTRIPRMLIVDDRTAVRGAVREFIEATTHYEVCDAVDNDLSAIDNATELLCDLILLHLTTPLQNSLMTLSFLRSKLPHVKIVGVNTLSVDLENWVSPGIGLDAIIANHDGPSKLVATLKALDARAATRATAQRLDLAFSVPILRPSSTERGKPSHPSNLR